ncbi:MAG: hypothetical protein JNL79_00470 [Myxococcales bacterium]|nr:hypothetical protein [Myxococcales bacterium]
MRWVFVVLLVLHGLIHLMGFAKAFGYAALPQLTQPIARGMGLLWLLAAGLVLASASTFVTAPRLFLWVGSAALIVSQLVIATSFRDARFGTLANVLLLLALILRFASHGPLGLRAEYAAVTRSELAASVRSPRLVTEADLKPLPGPVQAYLRFAGAVGQPQIVNFRATFRGRIRASVTAPWMAFEAEQHSFFGPLPSRLFLMDATMKGLPVDVFHRFVGEAATFRARVLSLFTMVDAKGPEMNRAETVTLFNDLCLLAPSRLVDPAIGWEPIDARHARARFTRGAETIVATLVFGEAGELVDFVSDDRTAASADGKTFTPLRWTTPVRDYRSFGPRKVMTFGEARWEPTTGSFAYGEFQLQDIEYDVGLTK